MPLRPFREDLENLYRRYNRRRFISPDPLEVVYEFASPADRELVALIAALLAYGRVQQILISVRRVLAILGPSPSRSLCEAPEGSWSPKLSGFRHRFQTGREVAALLEGMGREIRESGSLEAGFARCLHSQPEGDLTAALGAWRDRLDPEDICGHLLPDARRGGACKRLHLYLRWMVRRDRVDVGHWQVLAPGQLIIPLDTHMHRVGRSLGALSRKSCDGRAAKQLTEAFRTLCPEDPVRFDFALTRWGIRPEMDLSDLLGRMILRGLDNDTTDR